MAASLLSSCVALPTKLHLNSTSPSLGFSSAVSPHFFNQGCLSMSAFRRPIGHSIVCEAAPRKKADSAEKRARQAEKRRVYNKARKSEIRTRMKKVLEALEEKTRCKRRGGPFYRETDCRSILSDRQSSESRDTGARRKSRLARTKKAVEIHHGWCTPAPTVVESA